MLDVADESCPAPGRQKRELFGEAG